MQTVIETPAYLTSADKEGLTEDERMDVVSVLARNPTVGSMMRGTGGARKVRFAGRGKGKSGGYRIITFFGGEDIPLFLLDVFGKNSRPNLTKAEQNELRNILTALPRVWREQTRLRASRSRRRR